MPEKQLVPDCKCAITACRSCGSMDLEDVGSLGDQYISGFWSWKDYDLVTLNTLVPMQEKWPLDLLWCHNCDLLQLAHTAPQEILYSRHYWYKSGGNDTMKKQLEDVVIGVLCELNLPKEAYFDGNGMTWLDIGANDGTLLDVVPEGFCRVGVEPADNLQDDLFEHCDFPIHDFWNAKTYEDLDLGPADVITACGMFYDLPDPNRFISDVQQVLAKDGIFVAQLMCLKQMLDNFDIGNICHEHLEFYSYKSLVSLFERNGLEIWKVEENDVNGGSYRLFARHLRHGSVEIPENVSLDRFRSFMDICATNAVECRSFIDRLRKEQVWVYGASTKGNVILQYYGLDHTMIEAAADRNPEKHGLVMAGSGIPIVSEQDMRHSNPDYLLVLPYAFIEEFKVRERKWYEGGGKWLLPLPTFRVI